MLGLFAVERRGNYLNLGVNSRSMVLTTVDRQTDEEETVEMELAGYPLEMVAAIENMCRRDHGPQIPFKIGQTEGLVWQGQESATEWFIGLKLRHGTYNFNIQLRLTEARRLTQILKDYWVI